MLQTQGQHSTVLEAIDRSEAWLHQIACEAPYPLQCILLFLDTCLQFFHCLGQTRLGVRRVKLHRIVMELICVFGVSAYVLHDLVLLWRCAEMCFRQRRVGVRCCVDVYKRLRQTRQVATPTKHNGVVHCGRLSGSTYTQATSVESCALHGIKQGCTRDLTPAKTNLLHFLRATIAQRSFPSSNPPPTPEQPPLLRATPPLPL